MIPALIGKKNKTESEKRATELLNFLGLGERLEHKPAELWRKQQRVAVARALMNKPAIIMADEPSGNLDSANAKDLHALFFKLKEELGQTSATHNPELAKMADRCLEMKDGRII